MDLYKLSSYDYDLPKELIAQKAHEPADECKLLYCKDNNIQHLIFKDIQDLLTKDDVLFFNNSKVIKARIKGSLQKDIFTLYEDGKDEIFFLKKIEWNIFEALIRPWKKFKIWKKIYVQDYEFEVIEHTKEWRLIRLNNKEDILDVLEKIWSMPLPPYIEYKKEKESSYQAITAQNPWSVAAPTASLHFTKELFVKLEQKKVDKLYSTLHIWEWTFKNVDTEDITNYNIHEELVELPIDIFDKFSNNKHKNIIAVGTTSMRILESLPFVYAKLWLTDNSFFNDITKDVKKEDIDKFIPWKIIQTKKNISFETKLFIYSWFNFHLVNKLITNFHLPKSSLLMLVSAFMGYENMKKAYKQAIDHNYKFFSFWDAMMIDNNSGKLKVESYK